MTSRSATCSAVRARPCVSMKPTTTSVPRSWRRHPSLSIANVLPTPGAAPRYTRSWPRAMTGSGLAVEVEVQLQHVPHLLTEDAELPVLGVLGDECVDGCQREVARSRHARRL